MSVDGLLDADLKETLKQMVATKPWNDHITWLSRLDRDCEHAGHAQEQGTTLEACGMWKHIRKMLEWITEEDISVQRHSINHKRFFRGWQTS